MYLDLSTKDICLNLYYKSQRHHINLKKHHLPEVDTKEIFSNMQY